MNNEIYSDEWVDAATEGYSNEIEFLCPAHGSKHTICMFQSRDVKCSSVPCRIVQIQETATKYREVE